MIERVISFDRTGHSVDAIQRAAYRFSDRLSCEITATADGPIDVRASLLDEQADADSLIADFRNEVLDQVLRERIRAETGDVRNLVLALAFSRTGLADGDV
jgi:His-Xaa-Ser system protein HxsD